MRGQRGAASGQLRWDKIAPVVLAAVVVLAYLPVLSSDFVNWDDDLFIARNPAITSGNGLAHIWSTLELPAGFPNYPLLFTSYWLEYRLWGADARGYHATNLLLHVLNTLLVWRLVRRLGASEWAAGITAALFGLHPLQVESVAWVVERKNLLSATFYLAAFLAYIQHRATNRRRWYGVCLVTFIAALLSKTATVTLPASLLLWERFRAGTWSRDALARLAPLFVLALGAMLPTIATEPSQIVIPLGQRPLLAARCLLFYVSKLLVPVGLLPIYPSWDTALTDLRWWLPLALTISGTWLIHRFTRDWRARWGWAHYVCTLLPVLGLVSFGYNKYSFVADHYVYLACIGVFLPLVLAVDQRQERIGAVANVAMFVVIGGLALLTSRQSRLWQDPLVFWTHAAAANPTAWVAQVNLGEALLVRDRFSDAIAPTARALALRPEDPVALNNMGMALLRSGNGVESVSYFRRAVAAEPRAAERRKNLGAALLANGQPEAAEAELREAVTLQADNSIYHYLLARALARQGNAPEAIAEFEATLNLDPNFQPAQQALAELRAPSNGQ